MIFGFKFLLLVNWKVLVVDGIVVMMMIWKESGVFYGVEVERVIFVVCVV